jgi:septum formation protein
MRLILASGSPRRLEILRKFGLEAEVLVPQVNEEAIMIAHKDAEVGLLTEQLAAAKAEAALRMLRNSPQAGTTGSRHAIILAADTIVYKGRMLGKPASVAEALAMLMLLRAGRHEVLTGTAILQAERNDAGEWRQSSLRLAHDRTAVDFKDYSEQQAADYIRSGEPMDKAGAYAIQGVWGEQVASIDGDYYNVVGLPKRIEEELAGMLREGARERGFDGSALPQDAL